VADFLPKKASDPATLIDLLCGRKVPGNIRLRPMSRRFMERRCRDLKRVGSTKKTVEQVEEFNLHFSSHLSLLYNNCYIYQARLLQYLMEEE